MKRYILPVMLLAVIAACQKENGHGCAEETNRLYIYELASLNTKVTLPAGKFECVWNESDQVVVRNASGEGDAALLTEGSGTSAGKFSLKTSLAPGTAVRVLYPSSVSLDGGTVPSEQTQPKTKQLDLSGCGYAYSDEITLSENEPMSFGLKYPLAAVRVKFTSSAYDGNKVTGLLFRSIGNPVSGGFSVDFQTGEVTTGDDVKDYVDLSMDNSATVSSTDYNSLCFMALPSVEEQIYYVVLKIKDVDARIPVAFKGILKGGHVNEFVIDDLKLEDAPEWYRPIDSRHMPVLGYGYGETNTYLIQYKEAAYGATLDPDPSIPSEVEVDYRFTGDFRYAAVPDNVEFSFKQGYCSDGSWGTYTQDRTYATTADRYEIGEPSGYKIKVKNVGATGGAPILLMKDKTSGKILWSWAFWNIAADGTRLQAYPVGGVELANMDIGQVSVKDESTTHLHEMRRSLFYYQWGRPSPVFWQSKTSVYFGQDHAKNSADPRIPACGTGPISLQESLEHPGEMIVADISSWSQTEDTEEPADWLTDGSSHKDMWVSRGVKSIYDPCPKGWRVADVEEYVGVFGAEKVAASYPIDRYKVDDTGCYAGFYADASGNIVMNNAGYVTPKVRNTGNLRNGGYSASNNNSTAGASVVWTNATNNAKGRTFRYDYYWTKYSGEASGVSEAREVRVVDHPRSYLYPVRCQKDTDNR